MSANDVNAMQVKVPQGGGLLRYFTLRPSTNGGDWVITDVQTGKTFHDSENGDTPVSQFAVIFDYSSSAFQRDCEMAIFVFNFDEKIAEQWRFNERGLVFKGDSSGVSAQVGANGNMLKLTMQSLDALTDAQSNFSFLVDYLDRSSGTTQVSTFVSPDPAIRVVRRP